MNIIYVVKNMRVSNGVSSYIMNYYRKLIKEENVNIDFLIVSETDSPYYEEIKRHKSNIYVMPSCKKPIQMYLFLAKLFKGKKYDILHSNVLNSNFPIAYMAKKYGVPVRILHSHATSNGDNFLKLLRNKPFQYLSIHYSNNFFSCSKLAGESIFKDRKFYVVNNAIDLETFKFNDIARRRVRNENNVEEEKIIVSTVGRLTIQKNPYFILEIVKELVKRNINFEFWWFGSGNLDEDIKSKSIDMKINNYIKFYGSINDVYKYYSAMDLFILPSFYEGLPVVGIEAQANGLKCLFSDSITLETKMLKKTLFLPIDSVKDWCNTITECITDCNHKIDDYTFLREKYDINKLADSLYKKYIELLKKYN